MAKYLVNSKIRALGKGEAKDLNFSSAAVEALDCEVEAIVERARNAVKTEGKGKTILPKHIE